MYGLPPALSSAVEALVDARGGSTLTDAAKNLSHRYRAEAGHATGQQELLAYAAVRLPATFAAIRAVLADFADAEPSFRPATMLDLGAGPGTAGWAATETFPSLQHVVAVEREPGFIALGQSLAQHAPPALQSGEWRRSDIERDALPAGPFDLVTISFALTELAEAAVAALIKRAFAATSGALVLVEPGTTAGFARLAQIRTKLIDDGAHIAAPCPHQQTCPLLATAEWCHSSVRLPRSRWHRQVKASSLAFEDEKYSYLIITRSASTQEYSRLLYPVRQTKPAISAFLCQPDGKAVWQEIPVRDKAAYKAARKWDWGQRVEKRG